MKELNIFGKNSSTIERSLRGFYICLWHIFCQCSWNSQKELLGAVLFFLNVVSGKNYFFEIEGNSPACI